MPIGTAHDNDEEDTKTTYHKHQKEQAVTFWHIMRREKLKHVVITVKVCGKKD